MSQITKKTYNILPSRLDYFVRRMDRIKKAADSKIPPIPFTYTDPSKVIATTVPLDPLLIGRAKANLVPDARQLPNGDWIRDVLPITVEYGDLTDAGFDYIGNIKYAQVKNTATGQMQSGFFPTIVQEIGLSDADYEKRVKEVAPQLVNMAQQFQSYKDLNCDHCSLTGDNKERHSVEIVQATKDQKRKGKGGKFTMNLKKGDILAIGSACMERYSGINVNALAAFYELDRTIGAYGPNGSPQNPAGWGYKEMGVWDYAERMVQYYNQREREWLSARKISLWEVPDAETIYRKGTLAPLIDRKIKTTKDPNTGQKIEEGCFVERKGNALLKGREFDINAKDPNKDAQWMFQPFKGQGSVEEMEEMWNTGLAQAKEYMTVIEVNEVDGSPVLDPLTGDIQEVEIEVPSSEYIAGKIRRDWRLKIVPIFPPSTDSKYVKKTVNRMMNWIKNLTPSGKFADLQIRLQQTVKLGYVGEKTTNEFTELWRMFMFADFDRRKKADYKNQLKQAKQIIENKMATAYPNGSIHSFAKDDQRYMFDYLDEIYRNSRIKRDGSLARSGGYSWDSSKASQLAMNYKFNIVWLTAQEFADFPQWMDAKKKKEEADRKEREAARAYYNEVYRIEREGNQSWPRPLMRKIPYEPKVTEFLDFVGWSSLNNPARWSRAQNLFKVHDGTVKFARLTEDQFDKVLAKFRPQVAGVTSPPPAPTPSPTPVAVPSASSTPTSKMPRITQAEAKRKAVAARQTSSYQGSRGDFIPFVEGWVTWKSRVFGLRPDWKVQGQSIQIIDPNGNCWVVFHPSAAPSQPRVGNYYNLFDVELKDTDSYNGLKQNVINDPADRMNLDFVDATQ